MTRRIVIRSATLLCVAATSALAQGRRPTRPGLRAPTGTTPPPAAVLAAFTLSVDSISGGPSTYQPNGKVTLSAPAPTGGLQISLASDNSAVTVPALIAVPPTATEKTFPITTAIVSSPSIARISALSGSVRLTDSLKVLLRVISATPEPTPPGDGTRAAWRVTLSGPAPAGGITLAAHIMSSGPGSIGSHHCFPYPVFTQPHIAAGTTSGVVDIRVDPSMYRVWPWTVLYGHHATPNLQFIARPPALASVDVPATLTGGTAGYGTVRLTGTTPSQGCATWPAQDIIYNQEYTFYFSSNSQAVQVPASARVDPAQSERPFSLTASTVQTQQTATITVSKKNSAGQLVQLKQVTVTVTP